MPVLGARGRWSVNFTGPFTDWHLSGQGKPRHTSYINKKRVSTSHLTGPTIILHFYNIFFFFTLSPITRVILQTSTDHVRGKFFGKTFRGEFCHESERIFLKVRVFGENSGGLFGTRQACRDPRSKKLEGNSERIFRYLRDLGENFGEKPSPGHGRLKFAILRRPLCTPE